MKLAFDTGGTFTDFAMSKDDGTILLHKVLSTPDDPARAVLQGIESEPQAPASHWAYVPLAEREGERLPVDAGAAPVDLATLQVYEEYR